MTRLLPLLTAFALILVRLPFLLKGEAFFNSDEAVEGLMARHLNELPVFFWGQGYKGVPEVYLDGASFAIFGMGVIQLKLVTLCLSALATAGLVRLADVWHGPRTALIAALLLVVCPPALVSWQLSANAEVAILSGVIAAMLLQYQHGLDDPQERIRLQVFFWCGVALWIHPIASCAIAALALIVAGRSTTWQTTDARGLLDIVLARGHTPAWRGLVLALHLAIAIIALLFVYSFFGGTVDLGPIKAAHPQRSLRPLAMLGALTVMAHAFEGRLVSRRQALKALGSFVIGLSPVIFQVLRGGQAGTSVISRYAVDMPQLMKGVMLDVLPIVVGLRDADNGGLDLPWWSVVPFVVALGVHVVGARRNWSAMFRGPLRAVRLKPDTTYRIVQPKYLFAGLSTLAVIALLTVGGGFQGSPSSRYLLPFFGVILIAAADGVSTLACRRAGVAGILLTLTVIAFGLGQYRWYSRLQVDPSPAMLLNCLDQLGIKAARADYWIAYRLTFLAGERTVVAPDPSEDRYAPYARLADAARPVVVIQPTSSGAELMPGDEIVCRSAGLLAVRR